MKKIFSSLVLLFLSAHISFSQSYFIKFFSDPTNVNIGRLGLNADSNLVMIGNTIELVPGKILRGASLICIDTLGNLKFQKRLFATETTIEPPGFIITDNGFLFSGVSPDIQGSLINADPVGNIIFSVGYGDTLNWTLNSDAQLLPSGNIISVGTNRDFADNNFDVALAKFNSDGLLLSGKRIDIDFHDVAGTLLNINSGELLITGVTTGNQLFIVGIDTQLNVLYSKRYSTAFGIYSVIRSIQMEDSSFCLLIQGSDTIINEHTFHLLKLDQNLDPQWFLKLMENEHFIGTDLKARRNNIFLAGNFETETDSGTFTNGLITELDSSGIILWSKKLTFYNHNSLEAVEAMGNTIFLAGSVAVDPMQAKYYFISKTFAGNDLGCEEDEYSEFLTEFFPISGNDVAYASIPWGKTYTEEWQQTASGTLTNYCSDNSVNETSADSHGIVFPIPSGDFITFDFSKFEGSLSSITIYNVNGIEVKNIENFQLSRLTVPVSEIGCDGLYFFTLNRGERKTFTGKFLIQR